MTYQQNTYNAFYYRYASRATEKWCIALRIPIIFLNKVTAQADNLTKSNNASTRWWHSLRVTLIGNPKNGYIVKLATQRDSFTFTALVLNYREEEMAVQPDDKCFLIPVSWVSNFVTLTVQWSKGNSLLPRHKNQSLILDLLNLLNYCFVNGKTRKIENTM